MAISMFGNILVSCVLCIIMSVTVSTTDPKIIGGVEANATQFPYQISLKISNSHACGGSIVNSKYVVTAAHCVCEVLKNGTISLFPIKTLKVDVGNTSISGGASYSIQKINVHENYSYSAIQVITNDVAVLKINGNFDFDGVLKPIAIAKNKYSPDANCTISGWGTTAAGSETLPEKLHYADVQIVNKTICNNWLNAVLANDMLCAGISTGGIDSCLGDSGGPLVCDNVLTGIVSHGYGECAKPKSPGVYSDVEFHNKWISEIIKDSSTVIVPFAPLMFTIIVSILYSI